MASGNKERRIQELQQQMEALRNSGAGPPASVLLFATKMAARYIGQGNNVDWKSILLVRYKLLPHSKPLPTPIYNPITRKQRV